GPGRRRRHPAQHGVVRGGEGQDRRLPAAPAGLRPKRRRKGTAEPILRPQLPPPRWGGWGGGADNEARCSAHHRNSLPPTWGGWGGGSDNEARCSAYHRNSLPPTWGGWGGGSDNEARCSAYHRNSLPPTWGGWGGGSKKGQT